MRGFSFEKIIRSVKTQTEVKSVSAQAEVSQSI